MTLYACNPRQRNPCNHTVQVREVSTNRILYTAHGATPTEAQERAEQLIRQNRQCPNEPETLDPMKWMQAR